MKRAGSNLSWIIFRKEFREIFRDKRTRMQVIISPLIVTPLLFALLGQLAKGQMERTKTHTYSVGIVHGDAFPDFGRQLRLSLQFKTTDLHTEAEAAELIRKRKQEAVIVLSPDTLAKITASQPAPVKILTDGGSEESQNAAKFLEAVFQKLNDGIVKTRLQAQGMSDAVLTPFKITQENIPGAGGSGMLFLTQMLPYFLILSIFGGSFYAAIDLVAGEKERNTMETLLVSPASRKDIALGKFAAIMSVCLVSALLSMAGLMIIFLSHLKVYDWLAQGGLHLSAAAVGVIALSVLPVSVLFAGILLGLSTFSRNQKEAQGYIGSLMTLILLPAMASMFVSGAADLKLALVPILNASIMIKQALNGNYNWTFVALAFTSSAVYAVAALLYVVNAFQKESVLLKA